MNKLELQRYNQRIKELHAEFEEKSRINQKLSEENDLLELKIVKGLALIEEQNVIILGKNIERNTLKEKISNAKIDLENVIKDKNNILNIEESKIKTIRLNKIRLQNEFDQLSQRFMDLVKKKEEYEKYDSLFKQVKKREDELVGKTKKAESNLLKIEKRETQIRGKAEKRMKDADEKFLVAERKERKLEHYVRRLQRYYDEHNIKINLLKSFDL